MNKRNQKNLTLKGKITPFFFNAICGFMRDKHFHDPSGTLFFKIFCGIWINHSDTATCIHSKN